MTDRRKPWRKSLRASTQEVDDDLMRRVKKLSRMSKDELNAMYRDEMGMSEEEIEALWREAEEVAAKTAEEGDGVLAMLGNPERGSA